MSELFSHDNPFELFATWFEQACNTQSVLEPTAMCLATTHADATPSARMVLLKDYDARGFVFYTNLQSRKSGELQATSKAALCFYWAALERQIRIVGDVEAVEATEADAYFATRVREKQIGAWASEQSRPMQHADDLQSRITQMEERFANADTIPRPPYWSGWRVVPREIEFWQQGEYRLHDRVIFRTEDASTGQWHKERLYP